MIYKNIKFLIMNKKSSSKRDVYLKLVGARIRSIRRKQGMSQESLALKAGLDRSYVGGIERGERNISIVNLKKISDALDVSVSFLLEGL